MFEKIKNFLLDMKDDMISDVNIIDFSNPSSFFSYLDEMIVSHWFWFGFLCYCVYQIIKFIITGKEW